MYSKTKIMVNDRLLIHTTQSILDHMAKVLACIGVCTVNIITIRQSSTVFNLIIMRTLLLCFLEFFISRLTTERVLPLLYNPHPTPPHPTPPHPTPPHPTPPHLTPPHPTPPHPTPPHPTPPHDVNFLGHVRFLSEQLPLIVYDRTRPVSTSSTMHIALEYPCLGRLLNLYLLRILAITFM